MRLLRRDSPLLILAGLVVGLAAGTLLVGSAAGDALAPAAAAVGKLWLDALTMTVVPLVFSLLVTGVMDAAAHAAGGRVAGRSLFWFAVLLLASTFMAVAVSWLVLELWPVPSAAAALAGAEGAGADVPSSTQWLSNIIPTNPIKSAAETAMVPVVVFALLFGLAASRIDAEPRVAVNRLVQGIADTMLVIVQWVLRVAPIGVAALAFGVGQRFGGGAVGVLAHYVAVVIITCLAATLLAYAGAVVLGRYGPFAFARAVLPSQIIAVSTQSSLASLPAMVEAAPALGVERATAGVVLPLAVSLFRMASAAANVTVALYLAQVHGVAVPPAMLVTGAVVAALVSVAAVGLPAQVSFFAIIAPVCLAMGVPVALLPLLLAIETLPDVFRTLGNVTADLAVARIVGREPAAT